MTDITDTLKELAELDAKRTQGELSAHDCTFHKASIQNAEGMTVAFVDKRSDAAFIVTLVNAYPALRDEIDRQAKRIAELEEGVRPMADAWKVLQSDGAQHLTLYNQSGVVKLWPADITLDDDGADPLEKLLPLARHELGDSVNHGADPATYVKQRGWIQ